MLVCVFGTGGVADVRVCGYVGVWVRGSVGVRGCGGVSVWVRECRENDPTTLPIFSSDSGIRVQGLGFRV